MLESKADSAVEKKLPDQLSAKLCKLRGAEEIGREIDEPPHRVYYLWSQGRLPSVYKDGRDLIGSKSAIRRAHANRARTGK
jgi:hypothetical protein